MSPVLRSHGGGELAQAVRQAYSAGQTDYSLEPMILTDPQGKPLGRIQDGDAVIFCLRRGEREVQLTEAFVEPEIGNFPRAAFTHLPFVILTRYHEKFNHLPIAFAPTKVGDTLSEAISLAGLRQLHVSESEKFAHVTFFFNGGNHASFEGEKDVQVPSPRGIRPEQQPELSLPQVVDEVIRGIHEGYELIVTNFANGDVIGHTADNEAKLSCARIIDRHLGIVVDEALKAKYLVLVTADHGNLEAMTQPDGSPHVSHTANPVPLVMVTPGAPLSFDLKAGCLADVAPSILQMLSLGQPAGMTGKPLFAPGREVHIDRVLLIILDGWGLGREDRDNPIFLAQTPVWDRLISQHPHTQLQASGESVGLLAGKAGNSEAGHMNLGAGRIIPQDDVRLDAAMQDGSFYTNEVLLQTIEGVSQRHASLHLIGLLSEKSSHGSIEYPLALLRMGKAHNLDHIYLHIIFDGRSTEPGSAPDLLHKLEHRIEEIGVGQIVTGIGRGIALDRDGNYQKTRCAYEALVFGVGKPYYPAEPVKEGEFHR